MDTIPTYPMPGNKVPLILVVDDEAAIAETLAEFIHDLGYISQIAYNGQQALAMALEQWPSLVITDLMMPLLDGAHLVAALRTESAQRNISSPPIILLTAIGKRAGNGMHVDAVLAKPFDFDKLEQIIHHLLASSSAEKSE